MTNVIKVASVVFIVSASFLACTSDKKAKESADGSIAITQSDSKTSPVDTLKKFKDQDWLLIPGKSAGKTTLNEDAEEVYKRLGKPDGGDAAMGKSIALWYSNHDSTLHSVSIYTVRDMGNDPKALVAQIRITSPLFKTKEGIHTTSTLDTIMKEFQVQKTEGYKDAGKDYTVYDSKSGISFEMDGKETCVAIIIHKAGQIGNGTYLKFRTTNKFITR
ncbi:hypothetical protein ADIARSV_3435 [Arcticibacter svalbardensis MN12-7]|uniref:Lipoprotein n=1 Tax=Arcticibacter svalbardensis MN12-7 TaxID=1150600 RepID=R9GNR9_9SPHI|nr:hypothetical protein [Arcticibacter svalbardensis]EOR93356.1 hypothetical protein ADIARSV_3435 [Arcticibacter svalbardensis MN12-7]